MRWLNFIFLIKLTFAADPPVVYCDDTYGKYLANVGDINLSNFEFPIMSTTPPGSLSVNDLSMPKTMHPCLALSKMNNYKNQIFDIYSHGKFSTETCRRRCAHFVEALRLPCGERRPPPSWVVGTITDTDTKRKINCSNWDLPLTDKGKKDGIFLTYNYQTYNDRGEDYTPPYVLDNQSMTYLNSQFIQGIHLKPQVSESTRQKAIDDLENMLDYFVTKHPEMTHIAYGNIISFFGDMFRTDAKYYAPYFKPTEKLYKILGRIENLETIAFSRIKIDGSEVVPSNMTRNLKAVGLYDISTKFLPSWLVPPGIQFLEIQNTINDQTNISTLNGLLNLEHFILTESNLTTIKKPFLASSKNLISLTLQCNQLSIIEEGAFDHLTELKYLNMAGNRFINLPQTIFSNLKNLVVFDVKAIEDSRNQMQTFDETLMECQIGHDIVKGGYVLETVPPLPQPEKILYLDVRNQKNFFKNDTQILKNFKNVEILNIGKLGLTSLRNISLEVLCNLEDLNIIGNVMDENEEWIGEEMFIKINIQQFRAGNLVQLKNIPQSLIAYMRTASQIMYKVPKSLFNLYRQKAGCDYDIIQKSTMYGYQLQNESCSELVDEALKSIRKMEMTKMETICSN